MRYLISLLFLIAHFSYASVSTQTDTLTPETYPYAPTVVGATPQQIVSATASGKKYIWHMNEHPTYLATAAQACALAVTTQSSKWGYSYSLVSIRVDSPTISICNLTRSGGGADVSVFAVSTTNYVCSAGYQSTSSGVASLTGAYCTILASAGESTCPSDSGVLGSDGQCTGYVCASGYSLSADRSACTKTEDVDSCKSLKDTTVKLWVSATNPTSTACVGTCIATNSNSITFPSADYPYISQTFTYTGETGSCTATDSGYTDAATAEAANAAAKKAADEEAEAEQEAADADAALQAQKDACGSAGYDQGTVDGKTVITCKTPNSTPEEESSADTEETEQTNTSSGNEPSESEEENPSSSDSDSSSGGSSSGGSGSTGSESESEGESNSGGSASDSESEGEGSVEESESECEVGCDSYDSAAVDAAIASVTKDKTDLQNMLSGSGPGLGVAGFGFGNGTGEGDGSGLWHHAVGQCSPPPLSFSLEIFGQTYSHNLDLSLFCDWMTSVFRPVIEWFLAICCLIYIFFLFDRTVSDISKIGGG